MNTATHNNKIIIEQVGALLLERLPQAQSDSLQRLASEFLGNPTTLLPQKAEDQYGALLCVWDLLQQRQPGEALVRVYNTDPQQHRWHSNHSIVEILLDDMPHITASVTTELARLGLGIHQLSHPVLAVQRSADGTLLGLTDKGQADARHEACLRLEIDRQQGKAALEAVAQQLTRVLGDVKSAVGDQAQMRQRLAESAAWVQERGEAETAAFLRWLGEGNFLFLGYRFYQLEENSNGCCDLAYAPGSGLGNFAEPVSDDQALIRLNPEQSRLARRCEALVLTKSTTRATVQRDAHLDYVGVKQIADGRVRGEWRFFGLYTARAYDTPADQVPLLREKIRRLHDNLNLAADSYSDKTLREILQQYPRDEMLQTGYAQLEQTARGMLASFESRRLGVFLRPDPHDRFIKVMLLLPRDQYNTEVRQKIQKILLQEFDGHSAEFGVRLSENPLALLQFTIHCHRANEKRLDVARLSERIDSAMTAWEDRLRQALLQRLPEADANRLYRRFGSRFPAAYRDDSLPGRAVSDILRLDELSPQQPMQSYLYQRVENRDEVHFRVLGRDGTMALSDVLPILEQMGVRVLSASPYLLADDGEAPLWLLDFRLEVAQGLDLENSSLRSQFQQTFSHAYAGRIENDGFNRLVISAGLRWQQVVMLRALCKYLLQLGIPFSQPYMEQTLCHNGALCRQLVRLFEQRFDPQQASGRATKCDELTSRIETALDAVDNLDEDRILRHYLALIQAMLRTNYYQEGRDYVSFKLNTRAIEFAPEPRPAFEIFVYATYVEGVHLRGGKVARGGLRWSDRREDFRTEVLGLVKAQMVKNAVIVPVGAKGGFVPKQLPQGSREAILAEGVRCYQTFIRGLLDITDNRRGDEIVPPPAVVRHDADDPYLVVAADKGTATFSDIANAISAEYGFWLGDAFASGGSNGYDHKGMGITARGAWESVKRLFNERNLNCQEQDFSVVGIGDMAGDVFGNGMLLSKHIRLLAAFNHLHIFIDPNPDAARSWAERKRLFALPRSSWEDYDSSLISEGGGIFKRSAKSISLSNQAREALGISQTRLTPNELINAILKAPVDLLWNGGIGTYIKAASQSHAEAGDRANDALRINANELRAKVIGEGGNLGLTQRARIEIARNGGQLNSDAIDNAGGVDCSDHEVNLKILLSRQVENQDMTEKQRNQLLQSMTDEVAGLVLKHNYQQSQVLSLCAAQAPELINDHRRLIQGLEQQGRLNRALEQLPDDDQLEQLARSGEGLSRPEIAVLMAYSKLWLFDQLIEAGVGEDPDLGAELAGYFPSAIREGMAAQLQQHPLRSELLATHLTNLCLNRMGSTFVSYLRAETRCNALDAVRAFFAGSRVMGVPALWRELELLEGHIDDNLFRQQLIRIQDLLEQTSVWLLRRHPAPLSISRIEQQFSSGIRELAEQLPQLLSESDRQALQAKSTTLADAGFAPELAAQLAGLDYRYYGLDLVQLAQTLEEPVPAVAAAYFGLKQALNLNQLQALVNRLPDDDLWSRKARATLRHELDGLTIQVSADLLKRTAAALPVAQRLAQWQTQQPQSLEQFRLTFAEISQQGSPNLAMLSVAVRELNNL